MRVSTTYFRRVLPTDRGWFARGFKSPSYQVWDYSGDPVVVTMRQLDGLLDARRFPAYFWVAVQSADDAYDDGDRESWIESGTGCRVAIPPAAID